MKICQNIDLVQIAVKSNRLQDNSQELTYYFPKSVSWSGEKVDKIVVAAPTGKRIPGGVIPPQWHYEYPTSPIDGSYIYSQLDYKQSINVRGSETVIQQGIYFDFYKQDGSVLTRNLAVNSLLSTNNNVFEINSKLDLDQTCIHIPGKLANDGVIWLYVFYGGHDEPQWEYPTENITVQVPLAAHAKMSFQDIINNYVHIQPNKIRGIYVWDITHGVLPGAQAGSDSGIAVTLRDFNKTYIINRVIDTVLGMPSANEYESDALREISAPKQDHLYFSHDIDFDNSYIENLYENLPVTATIIFEY